MEFDDDETPSADTIANAMLREDMRKMCDSLYKGLGMEGGSRQFDEFCAHAIQFIDQFGCPSAGSVGAEQVAVYDNKYCNAMFNATDCDTEGRQLSFDMLLGEFIEEEDHYNEGLDMPRPRGRSPGRGDEKKGTNSRLDSKTLDALAKMMEAIPDGVQKTNGLKSKSKRKKTRQQDSPDSVMLEDFSTRPLPGSRRTTADTSMHVQVFSFDKLAKQMSTRFDGNPVLRNNTSPEFQNQNFSKSRAQSFVMQRQPMIAEDDWEYLEEQTLSSQQQADADPIISCGKESGSEKKSMWKPMARKLSLLNKGTKNRLGRFRSVPNRDKISFDDDGSVQVDFHG